MDFDLGGDQSMLKTLVERFVADRSAASDASGRTDPGNWAMLAEMGLLGLPFAEDHGGTGGGSVEIATAMEALGRGLVAEPVLNEIIIGGMWCWPMPNTAHAMPCHRRPRCALAGG